jgi:F0F1-type ATP synthase assembly protein I
VRETAPFLTLGLQLAATVGAFGALGWYLDGLLVTTPWLLLTGVLFGAAGGMVKFFRSVLELDRQKEKEES